MRIDEYGTADFPSMMTDMKEIKSLTVVDRCCVAALERTDLSEKQRSILTHIQQANDLDEIRLTCCIYLGLTEEAQTLRDWMAKRNERIAAGKSAAADLFGRGA